MGGGAHCATQTSWNIRKRWSFVDYGSWFALQSQCRESSRVFQDPSAAAAAAAKGPERVDTVLDALDDLDSMQDCAELAIDTEAGRVDPGTVAGTAAAVVAASARLGLSFRRNQTDQTVAHCLAQGRSQASAVVATQNPTTFSPSILRHDDAMTPVHAMHAPVPAGKRTLETLGLHWMILLLLLLLQSQQVLSDPGTILRKHNKEICLHDLQPHRSHSSNPW